VLPVIHEGVLITMPDQQVVVGLEIPNEAAVKDGELDPNGAGSVGDGKLQRLWTSVRSLRLTLRNSIDTLPS
jgi:hypothetical protein